MGKRATLLAALVTGAILMSLAALAQGQRPPERPGTNDPFEHAPPVSWWPGLGSPMPFIQIITSPPAREPAPPPRAPEPADRKDRSWFASPTDWLLSLFALILAIYAARLHGLTAGLRRLAEAQAQDVRAAIDVARESAEAARTSADAACGALGATHDHAARQLRAYVAVAERELRRLAPGETPEATVTVRNAGQTPAYDLILWASVLFNADVRRAPFFTPAPPDSLIPRPHLPPGETVAVRATAARAFTAEEIAALGAGTAALHVFGETRYKDAFDVIRFTKFRFAWRHEAELPDGGLAPCEGGNEAN